MEEKKRKKQEEKRKKDSAQKKAAEQKTKVPESSRPAPSPPYPANPSVTPPLSTVSSSGNGKRAPPSSVPQQQQQQQPAAPRYPPREVPPRFRQHEHKQLLKRGQPLPVGTLPVPSGALSPPRTTASKRPAESPHQCGPGAQYENPPWGLCSSSRSDTSGTSWDQVIINESDAEAWPSIVRGGGDGHAPPGCGADTDASAESSSSSGSSSSASMATSAGQQGHLSGHHSGKTGAGHSGNLITSQGGSGRGWGSGPAHGSLAGDGKSDVLPVGGRGQPCWSSSNFNLNLNPNANPAAWPVLGHEGASVGTGGSAGNNPPSPNLCSPVEGPPAQGSGNGSVAIANGNFTGNGGGSAWGGVASPDVTEPRPPPPTNVSFSIEPQNLNTDGPNHTKREPLSPIHSLPSWGGAPTAMGSVVPPSHGAQQVNGEGGSVWGNGDNKSPTGKDSSWDSAPSNSPGLLNAWGRAGSGGSAGSTWGRSLGGDWGKHSGEAKGWESANSPPQEQLNSWSYPSNAPASEGSSDSLEGRSHRNERSSSVDAAAPPLPRQDLDPRVLCNTGWGQIPVRQHTAWEMEEASRGDHKSDMGTEAWCSSSGPASAGPPAAQEGPPVSVAQRSDSSGKSEGPGTAAASGWGVAAPPPSQPGAGWGEQPANRKAANGSGGWGESHAGGPGPSSAKNGQSWGADEKSSGWDDPPSKAKAQGWGECPKPSQSWGNGAGGGSGNAGEWGEPSDGKKNGTGNMSWEGDGGGWKESSRGWAKPPAGAGGGWGDGQRPGPPAQGWGGTKSQEGTNGNGGGNGGNVGSWGGPNSVKQTGPGWGAAGGTGAGGGGGPKQEPSGEPTGWEEPSPPSIRRKMEIDDGTSTWGDPSTYNKTVNMWDRNNPVIQSSPASGGNSAPSGGGGTQHHHEHHHEHHHGHHHPSHAHGAPSSGSSNGSPSAAPLHQPGVAPLHQPGVAPLHQPGVAPLHQPGVAPNRPPLVAPGWGDLPNVPSKSEGSWAEPTPPAASVDNGTSAWGKPPSGCGGWGDSGHEPTRSYGRGNTGSSACKSAPKSMQDGWGGGGEELGVSAGQWEPDDGDVWNSATSQESNSSCNSWGNPPKKGPPKGKASSKQNDTWIMTHLVKQLTDMGFPREPAEEALKSNNMNLDQAMSALLEKKTELDKRGVGIPDYNNGLVSKPLGCRPSAISKESSSDRAPFLEKDGGLAEDTPPSPFMPSPSLKLPLSSSALPSQVLGGVSSGLTMQNLNNRQMQSGMFGSTGAAHARAMQPPPPPQAPPTQPSVPPLNSSQPNLRAQVPQFLSPQVQAQLLQFAAKNIGLNPALLTSPINSQQMTLLYQLQQLQVAYQRLQIQQQMMQAQRNVSGPLRQQEQQVARTITNMQQQIQQHQRQLAQALLMKQQQAPPPPPPHAGLHPGSNATKSALDGFPAHPPAPGLSDLQTKEPQSSPSSYAPYQLSGLNTNMNVNCMEVGGQPMKEPPQPQSRLSQWTHPNPMENLTGNPGHLEPNLNKHGAIPGPNLGHPGKPPLDDSYSPYNLMASSESPASPLVPPDSWGQGKGDKISNGTNINWPPEFCPGVPWKGLQNIDPETDPNMTPGSVLSGPTINTNIQDVNRFLLRDRNGGSSPPPSQNEASPLTGAWPFGVYSSSITLPSPDGDTAGKLSDRKSAWSPGPSSHTQASLSHDLWKVPPGSRGAPAPSRPPPGLTNAKPSSTWGGNTLGLVPGWGSSYSSGGTTWSTDSSSRTSSWLVLRNLTPQIDGSTLRTLCMQHGPLITFHLNLTQGNAVVRYSSKEEAAKAQKSLHMCVLGNTTILAEFAGEEEVNRFFAQGQSLTPTTSWQANQGTNQTRLGGGGASHAMGHWNSGSLGGGAKAGGDLLWGGVQQYSNLWGPPSGEDARVIGSPTPINTLLPGDLLSGESM